MYDELVATMRRQCVEMSCGNCGTCVNRQAADAIEQLSNAGSAYGRGWTLGYDAGREESKPRWIPVSERLPEQKINQNTLDFEYVLCVTTFGDVRPYKFGRRIGQGEPHFWNGAGYVDTYVTHWMPLPQPPKEESYGV